MVALGKTQLDALRHRLEEERSRIQTDVDDIQNNNVRAENQYDTEFSGYGNHLADTGTETYEQERNLAIEQNLQSQLGTIDRALEKISQGTYGVCDNCGQDISPERLEARPESTLCISCAQKLEVSGPK